MGIEIKARLLNEPGLRSTEISNGGGSTSGDEYIQSRQRQGARALPLLSASRIPYATRHSQRPCRVLT